MEHSHNDEFVCNKCDNQVQETDEFCPSCGTIFMDNIFCKNHPYQNAEGVCIICCTAYCDQCAGWTNGVFLCDKHEYYEIYEGMARVFGTSDVSLAHHTKNSLEEAGLHPFIYSRKASPIHVGGPSHSLFRASGEYDGHIINEIKVMVPCQEVIQAEQELKMLKILS